MATKSETKSRLEGELQVVLPIDPLLIKSEDEDDEKVQAPAVYEAAPDPLDEINNFYDDSNNEFNSTSYCEPLQPVLDKPSKKEKKEKVKKLKKKRKKKDKHKKDGVEEQDKDINNIVKRESNEESPVKNEFSTPCYQTSNQPQENKKPQITPNIWSNTLMPHMKPQLNLPLDRLHVTNTLTRYRPRAHVPQNAQTYNNTNSQSNTIINTINTSSNMSVSSNLSDSCDSDGFELKNWKLKEEGGYVTIDFSAERGENEEEKKKRLKREKDRKYRATLSQDKIQANREACNRRYRERKMLETPEEMERRRLIRNELAALRRERIKMTETEEERELRRQKYREKNRTNRMKLSEEQKAKRRAANTRRMQNLSEDQMIRRKESLAKSNEKQRQKRKEMKLQKMLAGKNYSALTAMDMQDSCSSSNCY